MTNHVVQCPKIKFRLTLISACDGCPFYGGLQVVNPDDRLSWGERHRIICKHPIHRAIATVEVPNG